MIKVLKAGLETTVQDSGRIGLYEIGMPPSGAMDQYAFSVANQLVGNKENAAVLEITYLGPVLAFEEEAVIAITGGEIQPKINDKQVSLWTTLKVKAGDVLSFEIVKFGARVYLAIQGGIDVPLIFESRSTYTLCGIGGFQGRSLKEGDTLQVGSYAESNVPTGTTISDRFIPKYSKHHEIRLVMGLCSYRLTPESIENFLSTEWTVTPEANRVGYRFKGCSLEFIQRKQPFGAGSNLSNVVDLGYPIGSIQVNGMEPIALLNDAVTGGGYATIGTIISTDLSKMGQVKTNDTVRFISVSVDEAIQARQEQKDKLQMIKNEITKCIKERI